MADLEGMEARVIARVCNEGGVNVVTEGPAVGVIEPTTPMYRIRCAMQFAEPWHPSVMLRQSDARLLLRLMSVAEDLNGAWGDDVDYWLEELNVLMGELTSPRATQVSEERPAPASSSTPSVPNAPTRVPENLPDTQGKD